MSTTKTRRSLSLLAAFAVAAGALALPAATSATQAAPAFGLAATETRAPSLVDLDVNKTGSITIHKYVKDANNGTTEGNGLEDTSNHGTPLANAKFAVERLTNVDLTTQAGWVVRSTVFRRSTVKVAPSRGVPVAVASSRPLPAVVPLVSSFTSL